MQKLRPFFAVILMSVSMASPALAVGAIAIDDETGQHPDDVGYGFSIGHSSRAIAERAALRQCHSRNDTCRIVVWFETCGAYVVSHSKYGAGWGSTERKAIASAYEECGRNCRLVVAKCE